MKLPFKIVDADGHIVEEAARLRDYMTPPYNTYLMESAPDRQGRVGHGSAIANRAFHDTTIGGKLGSTGPAGFPTPQDWLETMDLGGIEMTYLFPTNTLTYGYIYDPEYMVALTQAYNTFVAEEWLTASPRFQAAALMPLANVDAAVRELKRTFGGLGFSGAMVHAMGFGGLGDQKFDPFYQEAQDLSCVVAVHGDNADFMKFNKFIQRHTASLPMSNMLQLVHMTYEGVFERFPNLRVGYLETGCTWVPFFMNRMDEEWEKRGSIEAPQCKNRPSEYIKSGNIFFHAEPSEDLIPQVVELVGEGALFYASDWPHWDNEYPQNIEYFWRRQDLIESSKKAILADNCKRMYGVQNQP